MTGKERGRKEGKGKEREMEGDRKDGKKEKQERENERKGKRTVLPSKL